MMVVGVLLLTTNAGFGEPSAQIGVRWEPARVPSFIKQPIVPTKLPGANEAIGGIPSSHKRVVALRINTPSRQSLCTGVLIAARFVLTAAHCFCENGALVGDKPWVTNVDNLRNAKETDWVRAIDRRLYPGWSCSDMTRAQDIAIVKLAERRLTITNKEREEGTLPLRVCGSSGPYIFPQYSLLSTIPNFKSLTSWNPSNLKLYGYGLTGPFDDSERGIRISVKLGVSSLACTSLKAKELGCRPFMEMILGAGSNDVGRRSACQGDSGGPVYLNRGNGADHLVGLVSRSVSFVSRPGDSACLRGTIFTHLGLPSIRQWLVAEGVPTNTPPLETLNQISSCKVAG